MTHSDPDFPRFVAGFADGPCTFTLVNSCPDPGDLDRPAPFPAAGTPQPVLPPHDFRLCMVSPEHRPRWECSRCGTVTTSPDGCNLGCPGGGDVDAPPGIGGRRAWTAEDIDKAHDAVFARPDPPPPQSLAEARVHCRATLERLAAGECFVPDALAAVEGVAQAVRAECRRPAAKVANECQTARHGVWLTEGMNLESPEEVQAGAETAQFIVAQIDALGLGGPPA